jgi:hypothetical protein
MHPIYATVFYRQRLHFIGSCCLCVRVATLPPTAASGFYNVGNTTGDTCRMTTTGSSGQVHLHTASTPQNIGARAYVVVTRLCNGRCNVFLPTQPTARVAVANISTKSEKKNTRYVFVLFVAHTNWHFCFLAAQAINLKHLLAQTEHLRTLQCRLKQIRK